MNTNFAKLVAIGIMGGVVKALFAAPRPVVNQTINQPAPLKAVETPKENN